MKAKTRLILGFIVSFVGVAIIILSTVDFLAGWQKLPSYVGLTGLVIALIGRSLNARNLEMRDKSNK
jgi:hypothetical protein